jgi:hypothetical protein
MFLCCSDRDLTNGLVLISQLPSNNNLEINDNAEIKLDAQFFYELDLAIDIYQHYHLKYLQNPEHNRIFHDIIKYGNIKLQINNKKLKFNGLYVILINLFIYLINPRGKYDKTLFEMKKYIKKIPLLIAKRLII